MPVSSEIRRIHDLCRSLCPTPVPHGLKNRRELCGFSFLSFRLSCVFDCTLVREYRWTVRAAEWSHECNRDTIDRSMYAPIILCVRIQVLLLIFNIMLKWMRPLL